MFPRTIRWHGHTWSYVDGHVDYYARTDEDGTPWVLGIDTLDADGEPDGRCGPPELGQRAIAYPEIDPPGIDDDRTERTDCFRLDDAAAEAEYEEAYEERRR